MSGVTVPLGGYHVDSVRPLHLSSQNQAVTLAVPEFYGGTVVAWYFLNKITVHLIFIIEQVSAVKHLILRTIGQAKRLIAIVVGFTVLAAGIAMILLPGPAIIVIPLGLTILATEFIWARTILKRVKERIQRMRR